MTFLEKIFLISGLVLAAFSAAGQPVFMPSVIYGRSDCPWRTVLYPEGFVGEKGVTFTINGAREAALTEDMDSVLLCSGDTSFTVKIPVVLTDPEELPRNVRARVLCFGESTTAVRCRNPYDTDGEGKNWVMLATEELPDGVEMTGNIGHGGWATYTYLNWPCAAKLDPHAPETFFRPEEMWYALGLESLTGEKFNGSARQLSLIVHTPFGKYQMDGSPALWELVRRLGTENAYPDFPVNEKYTGSQEQVSSLRDWAERLMDNPINEFYDRKTAENEDHAFSLDAYLERTGEGRPTHVIINLGINDGDGLNSIESSAQCHERLMKCFGNIPVAHFVNRWPGVCDTSLWEGYIPRQYEINGNTYNLLCLQEQWKAVDAKLDNIYGLDVWHCQFPASQLQERITQEGKLDCSLNDVHTGYMGEATTAWQAVCWLYFMLTQK